MANIFQGLFGAPKAADSPVPVAEDPDFADFAAAPAPSPVSIIPDLSSRFSAILARPTAIAPRPYTAWYRVWERTSPADFYQELVIIPLLLLTVVFFLWAAKVNKTKVRKWAEVVVPRLQDEFAVVGLPATSAADKEAGPVDKLQQKTATEYVTYATGRLNIAALDIKLTLLKRYNPLIVLGESLLALFFESLPAPVEKMEATSYVFDGKEADLVPAAKGEPGKQGVEQRVRAGGSQFDGFVWAIVNKDLMKRLRDDRYDLSLTTTKDHSRLPVWATVMSESGEITEALITTELVRAIEAIGDSFESLIITDQPMDRPKKLEDTVPKKQVSLSVRLPPSDDFAKLAPIFEYFVRLPDQLVLSAHFRTEAMRRVRQTREDEIRKITKVDDDSKAEERRLKGDKEKKEKRDAALKNLSSDEQRKYLEKEREKNHKRSQKKRSVRG